MSKPIEHALGTTVELELPPARGGNTVLTVELGTSCMQCHLTGLGHSTCKTVRCSSNSRSDFLSVVYKAVES